MGEEDGGDDGGGGQRRWEGGGGDDDDAEGSPALPAPGAQMVLVLPSSLPVAVVIGRKTAAAIGEKGNADGREEEATTMTWRALQRCPRMRSPPP
uniref:Uncharacterized protein n=1 Tax=Oryza sativa subsp. japonica TaxID=39947 RepID=Q6K896_ORYSJ|nr:hypothetical protein [Oryza sativa Japonica Group]